jgi:hypothetical protein
MHEHQKWRSSIFFALVVTGMGCAEYVTDPGHTHAGCNAWYDNAWTTYVRSYLAHSDYRSCPLGLQPGQQATSGATVYDDTAPPNEPGDPWLLDVQLFVYIIGSDRECVTPLGYTQSSTFYLGQNRSGSGPYQWQASAWVTWTVQSSPEYVCFDVHLSSTPFEKPHAVITIAYNGTQT